MDCNSHPNITKPILMSMCFFSLGLARHPLCCGTAAFDGGGAAKVFSTKLWVEMGLKIAAFHDDHLFLSGSMSIMMNHHET